jgi:hypothetical protein
MQFYFAWAKEDEFFDPQVHKREDEKIISLRIEHNEGEIPHARIKICHEKEIIKTEEKAFISCLVKNKPIVLFSGFLLSVPANLLAETLELEFIAEPKDSDKILQEAQEDLKKLPNYDPLFFERNEQNNTEEVLDGYSLLPHWSRTMDDFCFSDILIGRKEKKIMQHFIHDSLKMRLRTPPVDAITCTITVDWEQKYQGIVDAGFGIKSKLDDGKIFSFTPERLIKNWWLPGTPVPGETYTILDSELKNLTEVGHSAPFEVYDDKRPQMLPIYSLEPEITLAYKLKQKRREIVQFELKNNNQKIFKSNRFRNKKHLTFTLQDITDDIEKTYWEAERDYKKGEKVYYQGNYYLCNTDHTADFFFNPYNWDISYSSNAALGDLFSPTYFLTDRGQQTIESAIERCKSYLAESTRAVEITIALPFYEALDLDCDTTLFIEDDRLPKGKAEGKIVSYSIVVNSEKQPYAEVKMYCSIGCEEKDPEETDFKTPSGIGYKDFKGQVPKLGILDPLKLSGEDIIQDVIIKNDARKQQAYIEGKKFLNKKSAIKKLHYNPTSLIVRLADINSPEILVHPINVDIPNAWQAPRQIEF